MIIFVKTQLPWEIYNTGKSGRKEKGTASNECTFWGPQGIILEMYLHGHFRVNTNQLIISFMLSHKFLLSYNTYITLPMRLHLDFSHVSMCALPVSAHRWVLDNLIGNFFDWGIQKKIVYINIHIVSLFHYKKEFKRVLITFTLRMIT